MDIYQLRHLAQREELDYDYLLYLLRDYKQPRMKIRQWLARKDLIRVKKGFYIFPPHVAQSFYSKELLANWIYGPSALSLHYALGFYQLIPERVYRIMSITTKRSKIFETSCGVFQYTYLPIKCYHQGLTIYNATQEQKFFIARPEKAVADLLMLSAPSFASIDELLIYFEEDMRIDLEDIKQMSKEEFSKLQECYQHKNLQLLMQWRA
ncbi:MAG: hypothetical protein FJ161_00775 [Gammaproteobacteria bacterium]|nr:hypothetical protein [Gammaproteobacteria bacterium]